MEVFILYKIRIILDIIHMYNYLYYESEFGSRRSEYSNISTLVSIILEMDVWIRISIFAFSGYKFRSIRITT